MSHTEVLKSLISEAHRRLQQRDPLTWGAVGVAGVAAAFLVTRAGNNPWLIQLWSSKDGSKTGLTSILNKGAIQDGVQNSVDDYEGYFNGEKPDDTKFDEAPDMVNKFYNMVTDFYEYGWGQSFHFAPRRKGQKFNDTIIEHENNLGVSIGLKPGKKAIDLGCGVGGPMRQIAKHTGGHVTGVTINAYQVKRAKMHNKRAGLEKQCDVVQGNFLELPFDDETFDCAYASEATCHAPTLEQVFAEAYRVLKPGGLFTSHEWLTAANYDPNNPEHVKIIERINHDNGLPDMRSVDDAIKAAHKVGFQVVSTVDVAEMSEIPWSERLAKGKKQAWITHGLVSVLEMLRIAPKGTTEIHRMLIQTAYDLSEGERLNIFTPMYRCTYRKPDPANDPAPAGSLSGRGNRAVARRSNPVA